MACNLLVYYFGPGYCEAGQCCLDTEAVGHLSVVLVVCILDVFNSKSPSKMVKD